MESQSSVLDQIMDHNRENWGDSFSLDPFSERVACVENGDPALLNTIQRTHWEDDLAYFHKAVERKTALPIFLTYICGYLAKAAGPGGLPLERSAAISSYYLTRFYAVDSIEGFVNCIDELMLVFAQEVCRHKSYHTGHQAVDQCLTYIYEHIDWPISLADLAQVCGYSSSRLQHIFPRYTGATVTDYIRREKVKKAKFLLEHTDFSCAAVSQKLSFCNQSYFIKIFKRETGMTPIQYKESFR